ncbi:MAG: DUF1659 domain-containing protein [Clostridiaceae bacterium]
MAEAVLTTKSLIIKYKKGIDAEGKDVFRRLGFTNISNTAIDDNLYAVGTAIGNLLNTEIYSVLKEDSYEIFG